MKQQAKDHPAIRELISGLERALGERLLAVVLYGPAARDDAPHAETDLHLMVLLRDLSLGTLADARAPILRWVGKNLPIPRLFSPVTLAGAADVFPIELGDVADCHQVLHGADPLATMPEIDSEHLRLQCERELREKLMRLREAYIVARGKDRDLERLMVSSFPAFTMIFRGCLRLHGDAVPAGDGEAAAAFCKSAGIDPAPLAAVDRLRHGQADGASMSELFARYYETLDRAVDAIDEFVHRAPEAARETRSESP
ncbi:MAG TPA: hypothetical protein VKZ63_16430 [Kofleriaceae bacterium]|nr:hypothetical protein [Kofleriaceae bacterium]